MTKGQEKTSTSLVGRRRRFPDQEETSTSQAGCRRRTPQESPTASSLVTAMFTEELRSFYQVPVDISLKLTNEVVVSTIGWANNTVYLTREQFAAGLHFPISSLV